MLTKDKQKSSPEVKRHDQAFYLKIDSGST